MLPRGSVHASPVRTPLPPPPPPQAEELLPGQRLQDPPVGIAHALALGAAAHALAERHGDMAARAEWRRNRMLRRHAKKGLPPPTSPEDEAAAIAAMPDSSTEDEGGGGGGTGGGAGGRSDARHGQREGGKSPARRRVSSEEPLGGAGGGGAAGGVVVPSGAKTTGKRTRVLRSSSPSGSIDSLRRGGGKGGGRAGKRRATVTPTHQQQLMQQQGPSPAVRSVGRRAAAATAAVLLKKTAATESTEMEGEEADEDDEEDADDEETDEDDDLDDDEDDDRVGSARTRARVSSAAAGARAAAGADDLPASSPRDRECASCGRDDADDAARCAGCSHCPRWYHLDCLALSGAQSAPWPCPFCELQLRLEQDVERILWVQKRGGGAAAGPAADAAAAQKQDESDEYLIKWRDLSYRHCTWVPEGAVKACPGLRQRLRAFERRWREHQQLGRAGSAGGGGVGGAGAGDDGGGGAADGEAPTRDESYCGIDPEWLEVERILDVRVSTAAAAGLPPLTDDKGRRDPRYGRLADPPNAGGDHGGARRRVLPVQHTAPAPLLPPSGWRRMVGGDVVVPSTGGRRRSQAGGAGTTGGGGGGAVAGGSGGGGSGGGGTGRTKKKEQRRTVRPATAAEDSDVAVEEPEEKTWGYFMGDDCSVSLGADDEAAGGGGDGEQEEQGTAAAAAPAGDKQAGATAAAPAAAEAGAAAAEPMAVDGHEEDEAAAAAAAATQPTDATAAATPFAAAPTSAAAKATAAANTAAAHIAGPLGNALTSRPSMRSSSKSVAELDGTRAAFAPRHPDRAPDADAESDEAQGLEFLVRWRGLGYGACTWEPAAVVRDARGQIAAMRAREPLRALARRDREARPAAAAANAANDAPDARAFSSPTGLPFLSPGAALYPYQLEGLNWLHHSLARGTNVILADEMGLGKTVQLIAALAARYHGAGAAVSPGEAARWFGDGEGGGGDAAEQQQQDQQQQPQRPRPPLSSVLPSLVVVPLSTLRNWSREFQRWAPQLNVVVVHGDAAARRVIMQHEMLAPRPGAGGTGAGGGAGAATAALAAPESLAATWSGTSESLQDRAKLHVALMSYEMPGMSDVLNRLLRLKWDVLAVDEGHRLKARGSRLFAELDRLAAKRRALLTGTPLQNRLDELFALLHFLDPAKFGDLPAVMRELGDAAGGGDAEQQQQPAAAAAAGGGAVLTTPEQVERLRELLRPHLLRRTKRDVAIQLPPKRERIVRVELSPLQRKAYRLLLSRSYASLAAAAEAARSAALAARGRRRAGEVEKLAMAGGGPEGVARLRNLMMELRKCCNHPRLFAGHRDAELAALAQEAERPSTAGGAAAAPVDASPEAQQLRAMLDASGKLALLDRLMARLREQGHRVLLYSQFTTTLDVLEDWLTLRGWPALRVDGSVPVDVRQARVDAFNTRPADWFAFLLSTRAGGLGINLQTADTVVIFDRCVLLCIGLHACGLHAPPAPTHPKSSPPPPNPHKPPPPHNHNNQQPHQHNSDWNPHNDLQAQARAHRLGQTRSVMTLRLVCRATVEERMMQRARDKMLMARLVMGGGGAGAGAKRKEDAAELDDLLRYGARELFADDPAATTDGGGAAGAGGDAAAGDDAPAAASGAPAKKDLHIVYDDAALERLLRRGTKSAAGGLAPASAGGGAAAAREGGTAAAAPAADAAHPDPAEDDEDDDDEDKDTSEEEEGDDFLAGFKVAHFEMRAAPVEEEQQQQQEQRQQDQQPAAAAGNGDGGLLATANGSGQPAPQDGGAPEPQGADFWRGLLGEEASRYEAEAMRREQEELAALGRGKRRRAAVDYAGAADGGAGGSGDFGDDDDDEEEEDARRRRHGGDDDDDEDFVPAGVAASAGGAAGGAAGELEDEEDELDRAEEERLAREMAMAGGGDAMVAEARHRAREHARQARMHLAMAGEAGTAVGRGRGRRGRPPGPGRGRGGRGSAAALAAAAAAATQSIDPWEALGPALPPCLQHRPEDGQALVYGLEAASRAKFVTLLMKHGLPCSASAVALLHARERREQEQREHRPRATHADSPALLGLHALGRGAQVLALKYDPAWQPFWAALGDMTPRERERKRRDGEAPRAEHSEAALAAYSAALMAHVAVGCTVSSIGGAGADSGDATWDSLMASAVRPPLPPLLRPKPVTSLLLHPQTPASVARRLGLLHRVRAVAIETLGAQQLQHLHCQPGVQLAAQPVPQLNVPPSSVLVRAREVFRGGDPAWTGPRLFSPPLPGNAAGGQNSQQSRLRPGPDGVPVLEAVDAWAPADDARLLLGVARHGFGGWHRMLIDQAFEPSRRRLTRLLPSGGPVVQLEAAEKWLDRRIGQELAAVLEHDEGWWAGGGGEGGEGGGGEGAGAVGGSGEQALVAAATDLVAAGLAAAAHRQQRHLQLQAAAGSRAASAAVAAPAAAVAPTPAAAVAPPAQAQAATTTALTPSDVPPWIADPQQLQRFEQRKQAAAAAAPATAAPPPPAPAPAQPPPPPRNLAEASLAAEHRVIVRGTRPGTPAFREGVLEELLVGALPVPQPPGRPPRAFPPGLLDGSQPLPPYLAGATGRALSLKMHSLHRAVVRAWVATSAAVGEGMRFQMSPEAVALPAEERAARQRAHVLEFQRQLAGLERACRAAFKAAESAAEALEQQAAEAPYTTAMAAPAPVPAARLAAAAAAPVPVPAAAAAAALAQQQQQQQQQLMMLQQQLQQQVPPPPARVPYPPGRQQRWGPPPPQQQQQQQWTAAGQQQQQLLTAQAECAGQLKRLQQRAEQLQQEQQQAAVGALPAGAGGQPPAPPAPQQEPEVITLLDDDDD
jgi:chromodomain-helicase-DNA-binding protein 4